MFGELMSQPSRLAPNAAVDSSVGQLVAAGLATSATLICASLLRSATRCARISGPPCAHINFSNLDVC